MNQLNYSEKNGFGTITIRHNNGSLIGKFIMGNDGYYAYWSPVTWTGACYPQWLLKELADKLEELNEAWDAVVQNDPAISKS